MLVCVSVSDLGEEMVDQLVLCRFWGTIVNRCQVRARVPKITRKAPHPWQIPPRMTRQTPAFLELSNDWTRRAPSLRRVAPALGGHPLLPRRGKLRGKGSSACEGTTRPRESRTAERARPLRTMAVRRREWPHAHRVEHETIPKDHEERTKTPDHSQSKDTCKYK